ncbi:protein of unknown function [Burkholderia multivorans]
MPQDYQQSNQSLYHARTTIQSL